MIRVYAVREKRVERRGILCRSARLRLNRKPDEGQRRHAAEQRSRRRLVLRTQPVKMQDTQRPVFPVSACRVDRA